MEIKRALESRIENYQLLKHPFYQAWEGGTLPQEALQAYAKEYGAFIANLPQGWQTLNDAETAHEEVEHAELWDQFAQTLDTEVSAPELPAIQRLVERSQQYFSAAPTAMGAMFAFEVQQPETASSKLQGLRDHFELPEAAETYFVEHTNNQHEAEKLLALMQGLSAEDMDKALEACEGMSQALWDALTDIYDTYCVQ